MWWNLWCSGEGSQVYSWLNCNKTFISYKFSKFISQVMRLKWDMSTWQHERHSVLIFFAWQNQVDCHIDWFFNELSAIIHNLIPHNLTEIDVSMFDSLVRTYISNMWCYVDIQLWSKGAAIHMLHLNTSAIIYRLTAITITDTVLALLVRGGPPYW